MRDFERPVIPPKFVLYTQQVAVRGREATVPVGDPSRGFLNSTCAGSLEFLRESGRERSEAEVGNAHLGDADSTHTVFPLKVSAGGKYLNRSH